MKHSRDGQHANPAKHTKALTSQSKDYAIFAIGFAMAYTSRRKFCADARDASDRETSIAFDDLLTKLRPLARAP
jgi:hypothetical protein